MPRLYPENVDAALLWVRLSRYLVRGGMTAAELYLDPVWVRNTMESMGRWPDDGLLQQLQLIEGEALQAIHSSDHGR
ncbi:hypothetical protein [Endothiovibrio diazotrophicus]